MLLLQANNISKAYGIKTIFKEITFQISAGDRMGVIGANGAGKTTFFRCIVGEEAIDKGDIKVAEGMRIGYLQQNVEWTTSGTIWDEFLSAFRDILELKGKINYLADKMSKEKLSTSEMEQLLNEYGQLTDRFEQADGYNIEFQIRRVARGLGFSDNDDFREVQTLSGGERTRLALAKLLLRNPELLLLDEPTNHLDMQMVEWLEVFLADYRGGVVVISHDRYFLDRVTNKTLAIEAGQGLIYSGNYSQLTLFQEEQKQMAQKAFDKQQRWIEKTEAFVDKYRAGVKAKQARGRQSQLRRLERLQQPEEIKALGDIVFEPPEISGERVLDVKEVQLTYGERTILTEINFSIRRGEGVGLVGPNGAGKTSLLKIITGITNPDKGAIRLGGKVRVGYFSQHHDNLTLSNRVLDEIIFEFGFTENVARKYLAVFLFQGDDVFKQISELSGGERARIATLKLLLSNANFLILDEPTNHLDIPSKEAFEQALQNYTGAFLVVSHDRYFLDRVVNKVLDLEHGIIKEYLGDYTYFQTKKSEQATLTHTPGKQGEGKIRKEKKQKTDYTKLLTCIENEIAMLEKEIGDLEKMITDEEICQDYEKLNAISMKYNELTELLNNKLKIWENHMTCLTEQNEA